MALLGTADYYTSIRSGYSNRIKGILTIERIKQERGVDYSLNWLKTPLNTCDLSDILTNEIYRNDKFDRMLTHRLLLLDTDDISNYGPHFSAPDQRMIDLEYERIPQNIRDAYLPYFKWLQFHPYILEKVEKVIKSFNNDVQIGVHVRNAWDWPEKRWIPPLGYFNVIDSLPKEWRIYLITHDQESQQPFIERYGNRIVTQLDKQYDNTEKQHGQDVAVESVVLSRLPHMVVDQSSTFADVAWWLGGCKAKVFRIEQGTLSWNRI